MSTFAETTSHKAQITTPGDREIHVERIFDAPRERVWQAFTDPALIEKWWGRGNRLDIEKMKLEPGGDWRFVENSPDGTYAFHGRYREITPPKRLVQTFGWDGMPGHESVDTATFEDLGDGRTKVVSTSVFQNREERDGMLELGMEKGLNESYEALDRVLAR